MVTQAVGGGKYLVSRYHPLICIHTSFTRGLSNAKLPVGLDASVDIPTQILNKDLLPLRALSHCYSLVR